MVIQRSPARVKRLANVFGSLDIRANLVGDDPVCAGCHGVLLPHFHALWTVKRVDVTGNYDLGSPVNVKKAVCQFYSVNVP